MKFIAVLLTLAVVGGCQLEAEPTTVNYTLYWTATGNDYAVGTASVYDLRYTKDSTGYWPEWTEIPQNMTPKLSGQEESITFPILVETGIEYFFAIKVADDSLNWSGRSNIWPQIWADTIPPMAITDLRDAL